MLVIIFYDIEEDVIVIVNDLVYGLVGSVWIIDVFKGIKIL